MDEASERLKKLIAKFVLRYNYWGYLFSRLKRKPQNNLPSIMGVAPESDGTISLFYNPSLMENTDDENLSKVIEHEGLHLLNHHVSRLMRIIINEPNENMKYYKSSVWNIAADCTVNTQGKFPNFLMINKEKWPLCFPEKYNLKTDQITEKYYLDLLRQNEKENKTENKKENKKEKNKKGKEKGKGENSQEQKSGQCQGDRSLIKPNIGNHNKWMEGCKNVADLSALEKKIHNYVKRIIKDSIKTFSKDRGKIPGHISDLIQSALTPPQLPYYQIIKKLVRGTRYSKFKSTPTRINRKRTYSFVFAEDKSLPQISPFPGKVRDFTFDVVIVIDTSGSMQIDDIREGLSGVRNIIEKDRYCKTTVLEVDTQIAKEYICKNIKDIQFNVKGRGGTTLGPGLFRAKELHCDVCLVFTDGYIENVEEYPKRKLPKKIIWIVNKTGVIRNLNKTGFVVKIP